MPGPVRYLNKGTQSGTGMCRYRTEIQDAGMPMPSYAKIIPDTSQLWPVPAQCKAQPAESRWPKKSKKVIEEKNIRRCRHQTIDHYSFSTPPPPPPTPNGRPIWPATLCTVYIVQCTMYMYMTWPHSLQTFSRHLLFSSKISPLFIVRFYNFVLLSDNLSFY